jgi:hypothetical protein
MRRLYWFLQCFILTLIVLAIPLTCYTVCYLGHKQKAVLTEKWRLFDNEESANIYRPAFYVESMITGQPVRAAVYQKRHPEDPAMLIFRPIRSTPVGPNDPGAHYTRAW